MRLSGSHLQKTVLGLGLFVFIFMFPHGIHGDGYQRFNALNELIKNGKLVPVLYSFVGPLISSPLFFLGQLVKSDYWWVARFNTILFLAGLYLACVTLKKAKSPVNTIAFALFMAFTGMIAKHCTDYYSEVFTCVTLIAAIVLSINGRDKLAGPLFILSVVNTPATLIGASLVALTRFWSTLKLRYLLWIGLAAAGIALESYIKYGDIGNTAYVTAGTLPPHPYLPYFGKPGFSYPFFFGLLSILFSFGKGLIFFMPGLFAFVLPWRKKIPPLEAGIKLGFIYLAGLLLIYSSWCSWHSDWFWGPRFFLFGSFMGSFGLFLLHQSQELTTGRRWVLIFLTTWSAWVSAQGIAFGQDDLTIPNNELWHFTYTFHYVPEFSALWRVFVVENKTLIPKQIVFILIHVVVAISLVGSHLKTAVIETGSALRYAIQSKLKALDWKL